MGQVCQNTIEPEELEPEESIFTTELEEKSYIQQNQLMNLVKLLPNINLYIAVNNNQVILFNQEREILKKFTVDYNISLNCKNQEYNNGQELKFQDNFMNVPFYYQAVICKGQIYIQCYEKIYKLQRQKLVFVDNIPDLNVNDVQSFHGRMFSSNDLLYVHNGKTQMYILLNDSFKQIPYHTEKAQYYYLQFCDQLLNWTSSGQKIELHHLDSKFKRVYSVDLLHYDIAIVGGIILVKYTNYYLLIHSLTGQRGKLDSSVNIWNYLDFGRLGLQFQEKILEDMFGEQQILQLYQKQEDYINNQIDNFNYLDEINLYLNIEQKITTQAARINRKIVILNTKQLKNTQKDIKTQKIKVKKVLRKLAHNITLIAERFAQTFSCEYDQQ
ncbi:Conserved_hypothetical protein [Hexamita inflata]|uniref:Uncharacterized protein n=1 Tax=Hexamita inflata TaxID=28002 RepID=A0AA86N9Q1_9EUKA|nr:Conserved hypothetical protein [Hexamita inflata]